MKITSKNTVTIEYGVYELTDEETGHEYTYKETIDISKDRVIDYELYNQTLNEVVDDEEIIDEIQVLVDLSPPVLTEK
jgi:hypothetical protein